MTFIHKGIKVPGGEEHASESRVGYGGPQEEQTPGCRELVDLGCGQGGHCSLGASMQLRIRQSAQTMGVPLPDCVVKVPLPENI